MGVYIPGMALPEKESDGLFLYPDGRVNMWRPHALVGQEYEAVPVPPHGRLIEESKVLDIVFEWCPDDDGSVGKVGDLREMLDEIEALPTIIPADDPKEE